MKRLKGKKGFTLVECVVAMAVLAIMSMLLTMILSVTLRQRNSNITLDSEIDKQVENIVAGGGDSESKDIEVDIKLYANGVELSDKIPGNKDGATAEKIEHKGDDVNMDSLDYNFDDYKKFEDISNGKLDGEAEKPGEGYEASKCFGALDIKDGNVTVAETSRTEKKDKVTVTEKDEDGTEKEVEKEITYYIVKWKISFEALETSDEKSVKLRIPKKGKLISWTDITGGAIVDALSDTAVRIQPGSIGDSQNEIEFKIYADDLGDYGSVVKFFTGIGDGSSTVVKLQY